MSTHHSMVGPEIHLLMYMNQNLLHLSKFPKKIFKWFQKEIAKEETFELNALDRLNIETAVRMGEKAFVTINGKTFREGDLINDALIEKIENEQITFKVGTTRIIKNVGI